jgi:hypothetical protein
MDEMIGEVQVLLNRQDVVGFVEEKGVEGFKEV